MRASYLPGTSFNGKSFDYVRCMNCDLHFLSPLLQEEDYSQLYRKADYHDRFEGGGVGKVNVPHPFSKGQTLLDYGCGNGAFLAKCQELGFQVTGVEFDRELVENLKIRLPGATFLTLEEFQKSDLRFHWIHLGDVLEHLTNPTDLLNKLRGHLIPSGRLMVEGPLECNPNLAHFVRVGYFTLRRKLNPQWRASHSPYHVFFSNAENQKSFFEKLSLKTEKYEVYESAWPFPDRWTGAQSTGEKIKFVVGKVSMLLSPLMKGWGNRFVWVGS